MPETLTTLLKRLLQASVKATGLNQFEPKGPEDAAQLFSKWKELLALVSTAPTTVPAHTHLISQITNLQSVLDDKVTQAQLAAAVTDLEAQINEPDGEQNANTALMGPPSGVPATPFFRQLVSADIPGLFAATSVVFVAAWGSDAFDGLSINKPKLTIGAAITVAASLVSGGEASARVEVSGGGTYTENLVITTGIQVVAAGIRLVGTVSLAASSSLVVHEHFAAASGTAMVTRTGSTGHAYYKTRVSDNRGVDGALTPVLSVVNGSGGGVLHVECDAMFVGAASGGILDLPVTFGHTHFWIGDLYLAGNGATGLGTLAAQSFLIGYIDHIHEIGTPATTTAISMAASGSLIKLTADEIVADTAYSVVAGATLVLTCASITGTRTGIANVTGDTASETLPGKIETATQAETDGGLDDFRAVTPLKLHTFADANYDALGAAAAALAAANSYTDGAIADLATVYQPLSTKLTAYAGGDTPSAFTLGIVDAADAAAWRTAIGAGTSSFNGAYGSLSGIPATFVPSAHTHAWGDITTGKPTTLAGYGITDAQPVDADLTAIAALSSTGLAARTAANTWAQRTITGTANQVSVANGDGVSGNPTLSLPQNIHTAATPQFARLGLGVAAHASHSIAAERATDGFGAFVDRTGGANGGIYVDTARLWFGTASNHPVSFYANNSAELLTLTPAGNLGLGTTSPNAEGFGRAFSVNAAAADAGVELLSGGTFRGSIGANTNGLAITGVGLLGIRFYTSASGAYAERMRINTSGDVGIGTTSPDHKLVVADAGNVYISTSRTGATSAAIMLGSESNVNRLYSWATPTNATARPFEITIGVLQGIHIDAMANVGIGTAPSGAKLHVNGTIKTAYGNVWDLGFLQDGTFTPDKYITVDIDGVPYQIPCRQTPL